MKQKDFCSRSNKVRKNYLNAMGALFGDSHVKETQEIRHDNPIKHKKITKLIPTEDQDQMKLSSWLTKNNILFYAIPNGGKRNYLEAVKLKRCGVQSGVPDLCMPIPRSCYHGLYLELKREEGGVISDNQKRWIHLLSKNGYFVAVAKGFEEAKNVILEYLEIK